MSETHPDKTKARQKIRRGIHRSDICKNLNLSHVSSDIICALSLIVFHLSPHQFEASVNEGSTGVVVNLTVDDRDDPATEAWRAIYSIISGDPTQSFEIQTNPDNNEGMLSVVKVKYKWFSIMHSITLSPLHCLTDHFLHSASRLRGHGVPQTTHQSGE